MKTFEQFIFETTTTERLVRKSAEMIKKYHKDPEKLEVYRNLLRRASSRLDQKNRIDYPGRSSARKDKTLIPSHRTSSFPELAGISTKTKNQKKLRKQRALGEIS